MIQKFTVKRHAIDFYSICIQELVDGRWEHIGGPSGQWPEYDITPQAQKRNPRKELRKDGQSYTFYACVYSFAHPAHIGKGWVNSQDEEQPDPHHILFAE